MPAAKASKAPALASANPAPKSQQRTMSAATRAKIAVAVKARWAKTKGTASTPAKKQKPVISAAGIERIQAAQKARWAKLNPNAAFEKGRFARRERCAGSL